MAGAYRATGHKRKPKTSGLPPATSKPGPGLPVDPINPTDPSASYNAAMATGQAPDRVAFNPAHRNTPDVVLVFEQAGNGEKQGTFKGKELKEIVSFYKSQINQLFAGQMDALANQQKETIAHASTRDAFAIVQVSLEAELVSRRNAEILVGDRDSNIKALQSDLSEAQQLVQTNQATFAEAFRARDNRLELQAQLKKEQQKVAELEDQLYGLKSVTDPDDLQAQLANEQAKVSERDTTILDLRAQLEDTGAGQDVIDGPLEFFQRMLGAHQQRTGGVSSISEETLNLLAQHQSFIAKVGRDIIPKFSRSRAICHIINAQISLCKRSPMKALDFLAKAKAENDSGKFDRRIDGRIFYWRGKALLMNGDKVGAEYFLEQAWNIERRPSSFGTLYNLQGIAAEDWRRAGDDDDNPNFLARGKALEIEKWLTKVKEAKTPSSWV